MTEERIVIRNYECLTKEQKEEIEEFLDTRPISYELQEVKFITNDSI